MAGPFPGRDVDILLTRYKEHAQHLRHMDTYDLRVTGGFLTVQLLLVSWFAAHPLGGDWPKLLLIGIDAVFCLLCYVAVWSSRSRRNEIVLVILNINSALGLDRPGAYLPNEPINPKRKIDRLSHTYEAGILAGWFGAAFMIVIT